MISKKEIQHLADLARLKLTEKEIKKYQKQLSEILDYIGQLKKINTKNISPCTGGTNLKNIFRNDEAHPMDKEMIKKLLKTAPKVENNLIKVKGIFSA